MRSASIVSSIMCILAPSAVARGQEPVAVSSRVESVSLFKNGLAVIHRVIEIPQPVAFGTVFELAHVPTPVHGTFWIESDAEVVTRVTSREIDAPIDASAGWDIQSELAACEVVVRFKDSAASPVRGRVCESAAVSDNAWNREYEMSSAYPAWSPWSVSRVEPAFAPSRFLVLESGDGRVYVDVASIAAVETAGDRVAPKRRQDVLQFTIVQGPAEQAAPATITVSYLAKGIAWAPAYRVDIADSATLTLAQQAVNRNEIESFTDAELFLISGYPSMEFASVDSLLGSRTTLSGFFHALGSRPSHVGQRREMVTQQAVMTNVYMPESDAGADLFVPPVGEGVDLHYQSIGRFSLNAGDSLMLTVARAEAEYERIVEWLIPDTRNEYGAVIDEYRLRNEPEKFDDSPWDALRFRNPLAFAMTTAPAMVVESGRFVGQRTSGWTSPGEQTSLRITKALSLRTRKTEREEPGEREVVHLSRRRFQRVEVTGELSMTNHRAEEVTMVVRRRFSGQLTSADESPRTVLLEEGAYSVNQRNELVWTLTLAPGQSKALNYRYSVLVDY